MISGLVISGDMVEEEDEKSTEGVSSGGYRTPPPEYMSTPVVTSPPSAGITRKRRKVREPFYKGYGVVYLPGDIKGLTDKLYLLLARIHRG